MRRRIRRFVVNAGLLAPALAVCALPGGALATPAKEGRDREAARPAARSAPSPADARPEDPIAAAFALFPVTGVERRASETETPDPATVETVPMPAPVVEVEPGVVAVTRVAAAVPQVLAYAAEEPAVAAVEALLRREEVAVVDLGPRPIEVPLPRRRPAAPVRLASLEPAPGVEVVPDVPPIAADVVVTGEPKRIPKEALPYLALLRREAAANKVPLWLAVGVGWVESKYDPKLRGTHGVVGLMQVMPSTARFQGYKGPTEKLLEAETNIVWGMKELGWDWAKSGGNPCMAIAKYKGGIATKGISSAAADYCRRAKTVTGMI